MKIFIGASRSNDSSKGTNELKMLTFGIKFNAFGTIQ